jgi:hypothetical protein
MRHTSLQGSTLTGLAKGLTNAAFTDGTVQPPPSATDVSCQDNKVERAPVHQAKTTWSRSPGPHQMWTVTTMMRTMSHHTIGDAQASRVAASSSTTLQPHHIAKVVGNFGTQNGEVGKREYLFGPQRFHWALRRNSPRTSPCQKQTRSIPREPEEKGRAQHQALLARFQLLCTTKPMTDPSPPTQYTPLPPRRGHGQRPCLLMGKRHPHTQR